MTFSKQAFHNYNCILFVTYDYVYWNSGKTPS